MAHCAGGGGVLGALAVIEQVSQPFAAQVAAPSASAVHAAPASHLGAILFGIWATGFLVLMVLMVRPMV